MFKEDKLICNSGMHDNVSCSLRRRLGYGKFVNNSYTLLGFKKTDKKWINTYEGPHLISSGCMYVAIHAHMHNHDVVVTHTISTIYNIIHKWLIIKGYELRINLESRLHCATNPPPRSGRRANLISGA